VCWVGAENLSTTRLVPANLRWDFLYFVFGIGSSYSYRHRFAVGLLTDWQTRLRKSESQQYRITIKGTGQTRHLWGHDRVFQIVDYLHRFDFLVRVKVLLGVIATQRTVVIRHNATISLEYGWHDLNVLCPSKLRTFTCRNAPHDQCRYDASTIILCSAISFGSFNRARSNAGVLRAASFTRFAVRYGKFPFFPLAKRKQQFCDRAMTFSHQFDVIHLGDRIHSVIARTINGYRLSISNHFLKDPLQPLKNLTLLWCLGFTWQRASDVDRFYSSDSPAGAPPKRPFSVSVCHHGVKTKSNPRYPCKKTRL